MNRKNYYVCYRKMWEDAEGFLHGCDDEHRIGKWCGTEKVTIRELGLIKHTLKATKDRVFNEFVKRHEYWSLSEDRKSLSKKYVTFRKHDLNIVLKRITGVIRNSGALAKTHLSFYIRNKQGVSFRLAKDFPQDHTKWTKKQHKIWSMFVDCVNLLHANGLTGHSMPVSYRNKVIGCLTFGPDNLLFEVEKNELKQASKFLETCGVVLDLSDAKRYFSDVTLPKGYEKEAKKQMYEYRQFAEYCIKVFSYKLGGRC